MENYTKENFVADLAAATGFSKVESGKVLDVVFGLLNKAVVDDAKKVRLPVMGGVMQKVVKDAHEARNPQDGTTVKVPKKYKVTYHFVGVECK